VHKITVLSQWLQETPHISVNRNAFKPHASACAKFQLSVPEIVVLLQLVTSLAGSPEVSLGATGFAQFPFLPL